MNILTPEFIEESHAFCINGKPAPGVTSIINSCIGVNPFWTKEGREAGKQLHEGVRLTAQYMAEGDLDYDSLDPHLQAYVKFCQDMQFEPDLSEHPLYHPILLYCGIPDQVQFDRVVVDFKKGPHLPQHALQLAAYAHMLPNPLRYERWTVQLLDTGKYKLELYPKQKMTADFNVFVSCLNISNWRERNGSR